jgi:hypothetical protein
MREPMNNIWTWLFVVKNRLKKFRCFLESLIEHLLHTAKLRRETVSLGWSALNSHVGLLHRSFVILFLFVVK